MHLFAAQPGGFGDDDGIIDLAQESAEIIILAAADSLLAGLADCIDQYDRPLPSIRLANWLNLSKPASFDLYADNVLTQARIVVVSLLGGKNYWPYGLEQLQSWQRAQPERQLILVPGDDQDDPELWADGSVPMEMAHTLWRYFREGGAWNLNQAIGYLCHCQDNSLPLPPPPRALPPALIYHPDHAMGATFSEWQQHREKNQATALLIFYRSHLQALDTGLFDALLEEARQQLLTILPVAVTSLKRDDCMALITDLAERANVQVIINTTGFSLAQHGNAAMSSLPREDQRVFKADIPVIQAILASTTKEDWQSQTRGLRNRDLAMQVALPEMDGRIISRAMAFKHVERYSTRTQSPVIRFRLQPDRARHVLTLAARWAALSTLPNEDKRIGLVMANYPTREGRIGNGVGLDTPASTLAIMKMLSQAGYRTGHLPDDGDALIQRLCEGITNDLDTLDQRPCFQSMTLDAYHMRFKRLPAALQQAVNERWGTPEQDPKYRAGCLMIAGRLFGHVFIGIQPARGFDIDLDANYHDPDLVPPHAYLAFYFWLTETWGANAVVHVGKHGNLEWLPGKGTALSSECWPEAAFAPLPHLYPFIVNDPGEGAQAKRRTQAVIIDHLMPPMARAELYGPLSELEELADEYYQALGMDDRRAEHLKNALLDKARESHVLAELSPSTEEDDTLAALDTWLCDIKESQIRHGLHRLGTLPERDKLIETLVALLRLPRGDGNEDQGILHALASDLLLPPDFDPLTATAAPWAGPRPQRLSDVSGAAWRTEFDTRERLEQLAIQAIEAWLDTGGLSVETPLQGPAMTHVIHLLEKQLMPALERSAENELYAIRHALSGRFVPPGPSGAPTRGRLDTLPTGRNFFSVDSRAVPSKMAWTLGQQSAELLIERHLQEHGDYPEHIGISVWGTSTMRTGGDDIAQALALLGVKPRWAAGSQRVTGFEIIPGFLLGRPRVDVTLRVSGLFRDAFPNLMHLMDAAIHQLAEFEEPPELNTIRRHVTAREAALKATLPADQARETARHRVFGSRPGTYGAGLQGLIDERCWSDRSDLTEAYLNWGGYAYGEHAFGTPARQALAYQLSQLDAVVQNQDNREHDLLDSDDYYQFQGGMTNAVTTLKGNAPAVYHGDHSQPAHPRIRTLKEELDRVLRSRALNPKWHSAMREHGYKGAFEMATTVDYLFAYDATTMLIADYQYEAVTQALLFDTDNRHFLEAHNPQALQEMGERLLEACQRGLWQTPGIREEQLEHLLLTLDQRQEQAQ
ncbi:cobaltochelatase subunit CobN [Larsenimonas rhizosphaerae]|uniref:cobaltochelatase subunit CobN n=1 Tax=Larsenimonas rhizosphaerae TaxID=2944682 RepID=UPI0020341D8B|nr:cobaltochelatase subunit CobN [Larsenimonas rhizosphaerae]MCM2130470.1 cobaltochelatase subunit CobN [Larsenimonas rhizosphaerae]